jgi:hypothetical protein
MPFITCFATAENQATVNIHMIDQDSRQELNRPVIVTKIWHYINVTPDSNDFQKLTLEFYKGSSKPSSEDMDSTNYYEWEYDAITQQWADTLRYSYYNYLNSELCEKNGNTYSFCVGVSSGVISFSQYYLKNRLPMYYENFTLKIYKDDIEIYSGYAIIEQSKTGLSRSHADKIIFNVEPFTEMEAIGNDYFRIGNRGNIPLIFDIDYGQYADIIDVPNLGIVVPPFGTTVHDGITLYSESWRPGVISISGPAISGVIPEKYKITTAPLTFDPVPGTNSPSIEIRVGRASYELEEDIFKDTDAVISFQYPTSLSMGEGEEKEITVYISGNGVVTLNFRTENIKIKEIIYQNVEIVPPISINSKNTSEYPVKIKIEALRENIAAELIYDLSYGDTTETFVTSITVGPPVKDSSSEGEISLLHIVAIVGIFVLVIIYMLNTRRKHRWR